jgi:hypothetical protein
MTRAEWEAAMAGGLAEVERERAEQLERILDARCPGSRRQDVGEGVNHLAEPLMDGSSDRVAHPLANALPEGLGFELGDNK